MERARKLLNIQFHSIQLLVTTQWVVDVLVTVVLIL